jgi:hypothetical protein
VWCTVACSCGGGIRTDGVNGRLRRLCLSERETPTGIVILKVSVCCERVRVAWSDRCVVESERQVQMQAQAVKSRIESCATRLALSSCAHAYELPSVPSRLRPRAICRCRVEKISSNPRRLTRNRSTRTSLIPGEAGASEMLVRLDSCRLLRACLLQIAIRMWRSASSYSHHRYTLSCHPDHVEHVHTDASRSVVVIVSSNLRSCDGVLPRPCEQRYRRYIGWHENHQPGRPHQKGRNTRTPHATYS